MFENLRNAINAAEWILNNLQWAKENAVSELDALNNREDSLNDWEESEKRELAAKLDAYNAVVLCMKKFVKQDA